MLESLSRQGYPADIPSRGLSPIELSFSKLWRNGPEWLKTELECRSLESDTDIPEQCMVELKMGNRSDAQHSYLTQQIFGIGCIINSERFSTAHKLYRVTAYILKLIHLGHVPRTHTTRPRPCGRAVDKRVSDSYPAG